MSNQIILKKGDTVPIRELELQEENTNGDKVPIDLTGSSIEFFVFDENNEEMIIDGSSVSITDAANGLIQYEWKDSDTKKTGTYKGEFVVTYANGQLTVPNDGYIGVTVNEDVKGGL